MGKLLKLGVLAGVCVGLLGLGVLFGEQGVSPPAYPSQLRAGYSAKVLYAVTADDARAAIKVWIEQIAHPRYPNMRIETKIFQDQASLRYAVEAKEVDMVALLPEELLEGRDTLSLDPLVVSELATGVYTEFLVLVPVKERKQGDISGLRQRSIIFEGGQRGSLPWLWIDTLLMEQGLPRAPSFFGTVKTVEKPLDTVLPVFLGQADCCVIGRDSFATMVELNPQLGKSLVPVLTSPKFAAAVVCCRHDLEKPFRDGLMDSFLEMDSSPQGKQMLTFFRVKRLVPFDPIYMQGVDDLLRRHGELVERSDSTLRK